MPRQHTPHGCPETDVFVRQEIPRSMWPPSQEKMPGPRSSRNFVDRCGKKMNFVTSLQQLLDYITEVRREHLIPAENDLPVIMVANWCAPSTIRDSQLALQIEVLQTLSQLSNVDSMAMILMPVWERTKGQIFKSENILLTKLAERQVNA